MKLRIIHKGLLLLLLPFTIQTVLFGYLFVLNQRAEDLAMKERLRTQFVQHVNAMMEDSGVAWATILNRMTSENAKNNFASINARDYRLNTQELLNELKNIPYKSERLDLIVSKIKGLRDLQADTLETLEKNSESFADIDKIHQLIGNTRSLRVSLTRTKKILVEVKTLLRAEHKMMDDALAADQKERQLVKSLLVTGYVLQFVLTLGLLTMLVSNITNRLNVLVRNANSLPAGVQLQESVKGSDEIAYLDSVLHEASNSLIEAAQNRQSIMNMIAHDIRSPLMSSSLLLEKLGEETKAAGVGVTTAGRLKNVFVQLSLLVEDLLTIDRLESGALELDFEMCEMKALVDAALEMVRPQAEKRRIELVNEMPVAEAVADRGRMLQVLNNLISNAIKYSPENSKVEIKGDVSPGRVTVYVSDHGKGISKKDLPHVFEKFFQATGTSSEQGFGLGLAICKLIVSSHGGTLGADSSAGDGSTFWFSLPVDE